VFFSEIFIRSTYIYLRVSWCQTRKFIWIYNAFAISSPTTAERWSELWFYIPLGPTWSHSGTEVATSWASTPLYEPTQPIRSSSTLQRRRVWVLKRCESELIPLWVWNMVLMEARLLGILEGKSIQRGIIVFPGNMTPSARKVRRWLASWSTSKTRITVFLTGYSCNVCTVSTRGVFRGWSFGQHRSPYPGTSAWSPYIRRKEDSTRKIVSIHPSSPSLHLDMAALQPPKRDSAATHSIGGSSGAVLWFATRSSSQDYKAKWNEWSICQLSHMLLIILFSRCFLLP